jgi:VanZ family protein
MLLRKIFRMALVIVIGTIIILSIIPDPFKYESVSFWDKIKHFAAYATLGFLCVSSFIASGNKWKVVFYSVLFCLLLGISLEILQAFVNRSPDIFDALSNLAGGAFGSFGALLVSALFARTGNKPQQ